jgi:hypothetical protein
MASARVAPLNRPGRADGDTKRRRTVTIRSGDEMAGEIGAQITTGGVTDAGRCTQAENRL